ncbi:sigma-70 family RNA polymerase sigma factor [Vreelandella venusta]|uniref:RNA polymerase sigma factor n=1 Tax=Vreelandella venusta TaxID=44935 RepID=UPI00384E9CA3
MTDPTQQQQYLIEQLNSCAQGDRRAFERLYRASCAHLYAQLLRIVRDDGAAQDCLQHVFIRVWHVADQYDATKAKPMTWLSTLARNIGIDWIRRQKPQDSTADEPLLEALLSNDDPEDDSINDQQHGKLQTCLNTLSSHQRQLMEMAFFQGLTHSELAHTLTQPLGSVKSLIRRGLERLKACLTSGI